MRSNFISLLFFLKLIFFLFSVSAQCLTYMPPEQNMFLIQDHLTDKSLTKEDLINKSTNSKLGLYIQFDNNSFTNNRSKINELISTLTSDFVYIYSDVSAIYLRLTQDEILNLFDTQEITNHITSIIANIPLIIANNPEEALTPTQLIELLKDQDSTRVILGLDFEVKSFSELGKDDYLQQQENLKLAQINFLAELNAKGVNTDNVRLNEGIPNLTGSLTLDELALVLKSLNLQSVIVDQPLNIRN